MTQLTGRDRAAYVQSMFTSIAKKYDLMNRLMTGGQDVRWRKQVIQLARISNSASLLDLGTGTGDLAREARMQFPHARVIASDFTLEMMRVGKRNRTLDFSAADALRLPFEDASFDAVISGFLMRNVINLNEAILEQYRILKNGGRIVILDTTRPGKNILSPFIWLHMHVIIPVLGRLITGASDAYRYLPETTEGFVTAEDMASQLTQAGFKNVGFKRLMFGTIAIHWGEK
ncbi:MAG: ubiquinone/menaquinone biosynthesis methyltransferase [Anaerolineales bacterium]|nr:MAG: ubiquinone/menaquinone biosynthesis methyltransferase [Anaerolineales bacterium]